VPTDSDLYEIEVLDGEVVSAALDQLEPAPAQRLPGRVGQPGVQTAVAAATGFVAGAATLALLRRYGQARLERAAITPAVESGRFAHARTYVVTVRQLG
jgi:hypothetical protein